MRSGARKAKPDVVEDSGFLPGQSPTNAYAAGAQHRKPVIVEYPAQRGEERSFSDEVERSEIPVFARGNLIIQLDIARLRS